MRNCPNFEGLSDVHSVLTEVLRERKAIDSVESAAEKFIVCNSDLLCSKWATLRLSIPTREAISINSHARPIVDEAAIRLCIARSCVWKPSAPRRLGCVWRDTFPLGVPAFPIESCRFRSRCYGKKLRPVIEVVRGVAVEEPLNILDQLEPPRLSPAELELHAVR
eukprot:SAG31_NODE_71_length_28115_cov_4.128105_20_plen_165_part_00